MQNKLWQYRQAMDLVTGDEVVVNNNGIITTEHIVGMQLQQDHSVTFYRLNVETVDNYFANSICVHNSEGEKYCCDSDQDQKDRALAKKCDKNNKIPPCPGKQTTQEDKNKEVIAQENVCASQDAAKSLPKMVVRMGIRAACPDVYDDDEVEQMREALMRAKCPPSGGPGSPDNCIKQGTMIDTPQGLVAVENLIKGDQVLSYSIAGMPDSSDPTWPLWSAADCHGEVSISTVISNHHSYWHAWYEVLLSNGTKLYITYEHPVLVRAQGIPTLASFI
jgi:hypothetical protein